nr:LuxR C-terminal-related transcriptional regulator [Streptomyces sp. NBC_00899]
MRGPDGGTAWPLVGRDAELAAFDRAWEDPRCRGAVLFGPAGVGKTRLAEEFQARAVGGRWKGIRTAGGSSRNVPLGALAHLLPGGADLTDPVRGFAAVARDLAGPRRNRRWVVLVDDLHLLDTASTVLLQYLLDAGVIRLIATVRTGEPFGDAVDALAQGDAVLRTDLAPFDAEQMDAVLRGVLGGPVDRRALRAFFAWSLGNALYLRELVHAALEAGTLTHDGEIWTLTRDAPPVPAVLAELISARLAAVTGPARTVLELLALCQPVALADAQAVSGLDTLIGLDESGLTRVHQDGRRTTVSLAHPLYGEVVRDGLPEPRRRDLLLRHIERVQAHGGRRRSDAAQLAALHLAATGTADPELLVRAAMVGRHAHDYRQVDALLSALPDSHRTSSTCLMNGEALMNLARWQQADALMAEAESRAGSEQERVTAVLVRTSNLFWAAARTEQALDVNDRALAQVGDPASLRLLRLNKGAMLAASGRPAEGVELLADVEDDAGAPQDAAPSPQSGVWEVAAFGRTAALCCVGRVEEAVEWGWRAHAAHRRLAERGQAARTPYSQLNPLVFALADAGQLDLARETSEGALADMVTEGVTLPGIWMTCFRGRLEWLAGDVAAARRWYAEAVAQARTHRFLPPLRQAWAGLGASAALLGDVDAAEAAVAELRNCPVMGFAAGEEGLAEAWLLAARGRLAEARTVLAASARDARRTGHRTSELLLLTDVVRMGGTEQPAGRLADLGRLCDGPFTAARVRFATGLAVDDPAALQEVSDELAGLGAHLLAAEAASAAAAGWRSTGHRRRATAAAHRAQAYTARCPGVRTPLLATSRSAPAARSLTAREHEVARLAAAGTTSKDIAEALHLSVRTVDNHLQHVYAKLGLTTRRQLAAALGVPAPPHEPSHR